MGGSSPALSPHGQRAERAGRGGGGNTCAGRENTCTGREGGGRGEPAGRWSLTDEEVALALPAVPKAVDKRVPDLSLGIQSGEGERSLDGGVPPCAPPLLSPNLDADFFLALLKGVAAQHLHFGHDLEEGSSGWGGVLQQHGTPRLWGSTHLHGADLLSPAVQHF